MKIFWKCSPPCWKVLRRSANGTGIGDEHSAVNKTQFCKTELCLYAPGGTGIGDEHSAVNKSRFSKTERHLNASSLRLGPEGLECRINANFNPNEPRDKDGKWTTGGSSSKSIEKDKIEKWKDAVKKDRKVRGKIMFYNVYKEKGDRRGLPSLVRDIAGVLDQNNQIGLDGIGSGARRLFTDGPTYGNYGGGHYSSGKIVKDGEEICTAAPVDSMDEIFMSHDYDHANAEATPEKQAALMHEADKS